MYSGCLNQLLAAFWGQQSSLWFKGTRALQLMVCNRPVGCEDPLLAQLAEVASHKAHTMSPRRGLSEAEVTPSTLDLVKTVCYLTRH